MSIKDLYTVQEIPSKETHDWLLNKHYAHRIPSISFAFGLYDKNKILNGVCTIGKPVSPNLCDGICGKQWSFAVYELNRLCVNNGLEKNVLSYFVGKVLIMLKNVSILVSYADSSKNHHGYIYQATNWIYTGLSAERQEYRVTGMENLHSSTILDRVGRSDNGKVYGKSKIERIKEKYTDRLYKIDRPRKHRYIMFLGNKKDKKEMRKCLNYPILPYPKGDNIRYDASYEPNIQTVLF